MNHKESASYVQIVLQVLRKALNIIKAYTINSLTNVTSQITQSIQESPDPVIKFSADNAYTMFYSRFRINSSRIKTLMEQLEHRVELNNQRDYEQALADCHRCYIQQRKLFIYQSVANAIDELVHKYQRDTSSLVRSSCSFIIHLCNDETQLYKNFFNRTSVLFEQFLEELCLILYDRLRPIIIHVVHIETLAELCSILKTEILMDNMKTKSDNLSAFESVCSQLLEDVQERFVYRTHIYIREEILNYNCSPGDISYPEKLETMQQISEKLRASQSASESDSSLSDSKMSRLSAQDQHGMWYPTLRRTLICLSKLYRCLDRKIFEGLAQETLSMCIQSLIKAAELIQKNKTKSDSELFLIKHLLILREQISPFSNEFSVAEVQLDFSKIRDAAFSLMHKRNGFFRLNRDNAFLDFLLNVTYTSSKTSSASVKGPELAKLRDFTRVVLKSQIKVQVRAKDF
ncbi:Conserved oligomeric Golgi complex subunit [Brachionus plicatilis]|uniref:Conserved oligomeric Golgi complex subunit n=1 Tax=Brachionus plicatilis TaxID=10195 RepID=A0A3M7SJE4_BRAPC|nr:Conserved oligomeric Golgi complex subunit [Brachionus plicatilis]